MHRRHFVKLSATASAALLLNRLTYAASTDTTVLKSPDEVWAQSGDEWFKLNGSNGSKFSYKEIEVTVKRKGGVKCVYVKSPTQQLNAVRLKWRHDTPSSAK